MVQSDQICCLIDPASSNNSYFFKVTVPSSITESFLNLAAQKHQNHTHLSGFKKGLAPIPYIQEHFKTPIISHLKDLGLKFFAINTLLRHIRAQKIVVAGDPELRNIQIDDNGNLTYIFELFVPKEVYMQSWKFLPFKPVARKKYRDIDKQVLTFLQDEEELQKNYNPDKGIQIGDWVFFKAWLVDQNQKPIFNQNAAPVWIKIGDEEPDIEFQNIFLYKKIGDTIVTNDLGIQRYFCENSYSEYMFVIKIEDVIPCQYLSIDSFKQYFKIKNNKELLNKITEVFSFNNDISQRRTIAYDALNLIIKKNQFVLPDQAIKSKRSHILQEIQHKSDFLIYKMDSNFESNLTNMAKKQLLDTIVSETIGYQDNINVSSNDIKAILQLTQRQRLKDFLYFPFLKTQMQGQEFPIEHEHLYHYCLKEKTVNHIIYHLTKK
jgi:FKBP-type peptidyl-prolyl cis-trans isomerase (trigger factor)